METPLLLPLKVVDRIHGCAAGTTELLFATCNAHLERGKHFIESADGVSLTLDGYLTFAVKVHDDDLAWEIYGRLIRLRFGEASRAEVVAPLLARLKEVLPQ